MFPSLTKICTLFNPWKLIKIYIIIFSRSPLARGWNARGDRENGRKTRSGVEEPEEKRWGEPGVCASGRRRRLGQGLLYVQVSCSAVLWVGTDRPTSSTPLGTRAHTHTLSPVRPWKYLTFLPLHRLLYSHGEITKEWAARERRPTVLDSGTSSWSKRWTPQLHNSTHRASLC